MKKLFWQLLLYSSILTYQCCTWARAIATEINSQNEAINTDKIQFEPTLLAHPDKDPAANNNSMAQVTSVSQLSDVQPTDWAFQALQSLVERYGCIACFPDGTYRGNRALTRYEFAAGLNACLDRVKELIATATTDLVSKEDLTAIAQLQEQFAVELATLKGQIDVLEANTAELEANQFSALLIL